MCHPRVRPSPCPQTIDQAGKACQGRTPQLTTKIRKLRTNFFSNIGPRSGFVEHQSSTAKCDQNHMHYMNLVTPKAGAQHELLFNKPEAGLLNIRLMLSSSFRWDQIYKNEIYNFGHTLLCYLSRTQMFNEPDSATEVGLLIIKVQLKSHNKV